ncbi:MULTISPECIES: hypothetical protein [Paenibacillus]|uniref:hypothetical protein n=1 Tax=Paenibacillus TaxID=44249 RepID=UPI0009700C51|nr:hypothetical protein [Paenibacillus odorifer]OME13621.1 hypothetical protein BSK60_14680 [Paenibacillus odorifer]
MGWLWHGKKIADAIVVNNSAYVSVRAMSEATGVGVTVEGKTIIVESKETEKAALKASIAAAKLRERLAGAESSIQVHKEAIQLVDTTAGDLTSAADLEARRNYIAELNKRVEFMGIEILQIKAQLGE